MDERLEIDADADPCGTAGFDDLPADLRLRAFGVDYAHVRPPEGGDLYITRFGWPFRRQLMPAHWFADEWYATQGIKLPGSTGHVYRVETRPNGGPPVDLVTKFSRVAQDVPITMATGFPDDMPPEVIANARFNSPFEEFGLVMELRRSAFGAAQLQIPTQRPLAIYAPAEQVQEWELGRTPGRFQLHRLRLEEDQQQSTKAIELDIKRMYVLLYGWIKGRDAEQMLNDRALHEDEFAALTPRVVGELKSKGFRVLDNKPKHFILRRRNDGSMMRGKDGRLIYGLVDFELLQRTPEHQEQFKAVQQKRYWYLQGRPAAPAPAELPSHVKPMNVFGVSYLFGTGPERGKIWAVGHDHRLFDYFVPDRWRRTPRIKLSVTNEVYGTRTRDNIPIVYRRSRVGSRPQFDPLLERGKQIREHGFNSPFEEVAIAELLRQMGISTTHPRAICRTGHPTTRITHLRDDRRFADHADLTTPESDPEPILSPLHDYYTIWDVFRGVPRYKSAAALPQGGLIDLGRAHTDGLIDEAVRNETLERSRAGLREIGVDDRELSNEELTIAVDGAGRVMRDAEGRIEVTLTIDLLAAYEYGLVDEDAYRGVIGRMNQRLRAVDCEHLNLLGKHVLLTMTPHGRLIRDAAGEPEMTLCNFELIRGLYRPLR